MSRAPRHRPLSPEKLGEKGEGHFKVFCTDADLIANKSAIDAMGWDYLVEYPYPDPDTATPLDKRPRPVECKIQVKTVWDDNNRVDLKLSAAERLAKADRPSFILVMSVNTNLDVVAMHVFHMLDQHLEHVLKRLRKATAEGGLKINHTKLTFNLRDGVSLTPDGQSLRRFITDACGGSTTAYHDQKQDQLRNLGFGPLRFEGKFTVKAKSETEIAELFLGLRSAELVEFEANEIRFGIKLPTQAEGGGVVEIIPQPVATCRIMVKGRDGGAFVSIPGTLYLSPQRNQNGDIPFRISTPLLEIFVNGTDLRIDNKAAEFMTKSVTTKELLATLRFHSVVASGGGRLTVFVKNKQIFWNEFYVAADQEVLERTEKRIRLVEIAATVLKAADAQSRPVSLSSMADEWVDLMFLDELIRDEGNVTVNPLTFQPDEKFELPPVTETLLIKRLRFPDFAVAYYAVMDVTLTKRPPDVVIDVGAVSLRDIEVIDADDDAFDAYCEEAKLTTGIAMSLVMHSA